MSGISAENYNLNSLRFDQTSPEISAHQKAVLEHQLSIFLRLSNTEIAVNLSLLPGDLIHNTNFNSLDSILKSGVISGEIIIPEVKELSTPEDAETHFCADFFVIPPDIHSIEDYIAYTKQRVKTGNLNSPRPENFLVPKVSNSNVMLVFDGNNPLLSELLLLSSTGQSHEGSTLQSTNLPIQFPINSPVHRAILIGLPSNFIKRIIIGGDVDEKQVREILSLRKKLGLSFELFSHELRLIDI